MQLLKITTTPIEYKIEIERPRFELKQSDNPQHNMDRKSAELSFDAQNIKVRLDTTELRSSMGLKSVATILEEGAQRGIKSAMEATAKYAQFGNQLAQINKGATVSTIITQQMLQQPTTKTVFLPTVGPEISWSPANLDITYNSGSLSFDWQIEKNIMDYVPGKFTLSILQYPKITVEYLGEPSYVPPSAAPGYEEG
ncbi:MAG: DUF6470 family protein [Angelakisella sp.]|nr:DUF6470 family protein [Angelakisella sp.]